MAKRKPRSTPPPGMSRPVHSASESDPSSRSHAHPTEPTFGDTPLAIWYRHEHVATVPLTGITTPKGYTPRYETFVCPDDVRRAAADAMCGHLAGIGGKVQVRTVSEGRHKP